MFKYNNNHIFTGYLKQLLSSFSLPSCKIYTHEFAKYLEQHGKEDPRVLESFDIIDNTRLGARINYLKNNNLCYYFCNELKPDRTEPNTKLSWKYNTDLFYSSDKVVPGLTRTLKNYNKQYDAETHEYLGEYLRFLRDYYNINLMPMYNCFNDKIYNNVYFSFALNSEKQLKATFNAQDPGYRLYAIPVKLFAEYTIAIDCSQGVEMFCGLYNTTLDMSPKAEELAARTYFKINKTIFNQPFLYDMLAEYRTGKPGQQPIAQWTAENDFEGESLKTDVFTRWDITNREQDLKLFIKVPASCKSSITILEGDYRNFNDTKNSQVINSKFELTKAEADDENAEAGTIWSYDAELKTFKMFINGEYYVLGTNSGLGMFTGVGPVRLAANPYYVQFVENSAVIDQNEAGTNYVITNAVSPDNLSNTNNYKLALYHLDSSRVFYVTNKSVVSQYTDAAMSAYNYFAITDDPAKGISVKITNAGSGYRIKLNDKYLNITAIAIPSNNHSVLNFNTKDGFDLNNYSFKPISKLQLLAFNTGESYPFADRLVEYLSGSAITPIDEINDNIKRAQKVMESNKHYFHIDGLWEAKMQNIVYDYMINSGPVSVVNGALVDKRQGTHPRLGHRSKSTLYDVLGYIDKDAEKWYASWVKENGAARIKESIQNVDIYNGLYDID